jgi:superfamily II DNA/RNA helicase
VNGFPKVERPVESRYELNEHLANLFERAMQTLDKELTYARYQAIAFLKPEVSNGLYDNAELISRSLAGIRKNGLVKRLESSFYAFQVSIQNFRQANQNMLDMFANDKVFIAPDLDINLLLENGLSEEEIEEKLNAKAETNPKNAVFRADDFRPEFVEMLRADQAILEKMWNDWQDISDDDDSKFAKFNELLKHELFKAERNPEQKLVVFSESVDTVEYLERRINRSDVLVISSGNRSQQFKTIRENFDANYKTKLNDYNIILTTDVLAEGVNLHRSNVIVNYDTPWNSTRLMQRIGRVNRIGSASKHIYNYVFYPSREGNREINLNQIAVSKIQTFHSTFGEDNQIYSQNEILDRNLSKLFDEALKEQKKDFNQEIPYYEELRSLYQTNRREYNRIAKLSLRSRTGRESRTVDGVTLSGDTLVFLKTNFRKVFFLVSENAEEISVLDALKYFKATPDEKPAERIKEHHQHVEKALVKFRTIRDTEIQQEETSKEAQGNMGAQVTTAISLLTNFMREIDDNDLYLKVAQLKTLAERGVITYIAKRLQRIQKDLRRVSGKARMTHDEALAEIIEMAKKYAPYYMAEEALLNEKESDAEIILSESFR